MRHQWEHHGEIWCADVDRVSMWHQLTGCCRFGLKKSCFLWCCFELFECCGQLDDITGTVWRHCMFLFIAFLLMDVYLENLRCVLRTSPTFPLMWVNFHIPLNLTKTRQPEHSLTVQSNRTFSVPGRLGLPWKSGFQFATYYLLSCHYFCFLFLTEFWFDFAFFLSF